MGGKKEKKKTSKIRLERRLLESDYTIKKMLITDVKLEGRYLPWLIYVYTTYD